MSSASPTSSRLPQGMRALAHSNFRLYFVGQAISILGSWIQQVALAWLVYRLTGSAALLGVTAFCGLIPQLLVGPFAGAWIDRKDKRRWLIGIQSGMAAQAFVLALLTWQGWITPAFIVAMALVLGTLSSFDAPLRQSLIGSFVGRREDLPNALALNAMLFNAGRFVGPPIAGLLLGVSSEAFCFAINGFSFLALILAVLRVRGVSSPRAKGSTAEVFREGLVYAWRTRSVRMLILTLVMLNLTASSYAVLLPVLARDVFGGDAVTLGWLWGAAGCGAFLSTLFLATRKALASVVAAVLAGVMLSTFSLLLAGASVNLPLTLAAMAGLGFGISVCNVGINMVLQGAAPETLRGRIVSFFTASRFGFDALGGLLAGVLAGILGAGPTLLLEGGVLLVFMAFLLGRRRQLLPEGEQGAY